MTSLQRVLTALNHERPDRTPRLLYGEAIGYVPAIHDLLTEKCAPKSPREYFGMDITGVAPKPSRIPVGRFVEWHPPEARDGFAKGQIDEWGVWWKSGSFYHFFHIESPLKDVAELDRIMQYPWPDLDQAYRFEGVREKVDALHEQGLAVCAFPGSIFEQAWWIRGMDGFLMDMMTEPDIANYLLDMTSGIQARAAAQLAEAGVDIIITGDDVATQKGLMISADLWRQFLKPRQAATVAAVKSTRPETKVFYHCDGDVSELVPELIEIGIDILNPVQPECMDPAEVKKQYGDRLCFWGTVSVQKTMPFGTPDDVHAEVRERIRTVGHDGGLILAPAHVLGPETPCENICAFFEAADSWLA